mmetsp:Transcript_9397/g.17702  ORF Transcript_9397/g.17702 Transcript_9397/m.17702 type:complete len:329 (+) Transcript_9397:1254-2240(+)
MSYEQQATVNSDGSTTFESSEAASPDETFQNDNNNNDYNYNNKDTFTDGFDGAGDQQDGAFDGTTEDAAQDPFSAPKGTDPAIYLALAFVLIVILYYLNYRRNKKKQMEREAFFYDMDGDKFNIKLPAAVEEYYDIKEKCEDAGWEPGKPPRTAAEAANGPAKILAQALMKRCIADIPLVQLIQKESAGMNKLYSQSMCSVKQWKTYQAAEQMISQEVEEVRAEADEIEPGWSQAIWRQAMQYHNMIKNREEMEAKAKEAAALQKKLAEEEAKKPKLTPEQQAEKAAQELLQQEEREKKANKKKASSGSSSSSGGMKKGFLAGSNKKK